MNSVIKGTSYILVHAPDMVIHNGSTQTTEKIVHPESEYLLKLPKHLRSFEDAVNYPPNQVYIGNLTPEELSKIPSPWYENKVEGNREGKMGEIMPEDEFYLLMQACDAFNLVLLEKSFVNSTKPKFISHPLMDESITKNIQEGVNISDIEREITEKEAEGLFYNGKLVGCVKRAHDIDVNLSAHVLHENLVSKASSVLALLNLVKITGINKNEVDYVIDCSEEAVGDINQRGGGNMAKAAAEIAGFLSASGSDTRAFCAAPVHAIINAAGLVSSGIYNNVIVTAGGSTAKLGMNGKDHVKKDMPVLEDVVAGFAVLISKNDGINPEILCNCTGRHTVGTGSAPQNVITSLVASPLEKIGLKITDIDKFSPEMQNPDITKPAGAGDVPLSNLKMIAALAVKKGEIDRNDVNDFIEKHGMVGWAPTQGHIPSGVPYLGFAREDILSGKINKCMIIGKGSLFLGRMTNLFDGVSVVITKNQGKQENEVDEKQIRKLIAEAMREFAKTFAQKEE